jgi:hypothetical protein
MIPARFSATCEFCHNELDTREPGVHQWTAGWVRQRSGGGGHGISLPERANRWAHSYCVDSETRGFTKQKSMF